MYLILLLLVLVVAPVLVIGGIQLVIYKLLGRRVLVVITAIVAALCLVLLISEQFAPPVYGNKAGLVGLGTAGVAFLLIQCLIVIGLLFVRKLDAEDREQSKTPPGQA